MTRSSPAQMQQPEILTKFAFQDFWLLRVVIGLQLVSHYDHTPLWLVTYVGIILLYSQLFHRSIRHSRSTLFQPLLALLSMALFVLYYRTDYTVDMAVAFLLLSSSLKVLEIKCKKDVVLFVYVALYLSSVSFLFSQGFLHTLLQFVLVLSCFYILLSLNGGQDAKLLKGQWWSLWKMLLYGAPLVVVCFLFFPRLAPLWSIPIKTQSAVTGISDSMTPGNIAELSQSSERAFRVTFSGAIPKPEDRYWRGLVLDTFDGTTWKADEFGDPYRRYQKIDPGFFYGEQNHSYEVMLEPHNQKWVFALEGSVVSSTNLVSADMGLFRLKTEAIQPTAYKLAWREPDQERGSELGIPTVLVLADKQRRLALPGADLQVPRSSNQRTRQYVQSLLRQYPEPATLVTELMMQFRQQAFFYTLKPQAMSSDFVDDFLFESRRGFCAHYAGSLAFMLRLAQIPARVVVGYQGGEVNPQGNYLIVHQYDAHAWVEAQLPEQGWVRLDPTAMVAPNRILRGLEATVSSEGTFLAANPLASVIFKLGAFNWLRLRMDELSYRWQKWVVNYNGHDQQSLVESLFGEYSMARIAAIFAATFVLLFGILAWLLWRIAVPKKHSRAVKSYLAWVILLRRFGFRRHEGETPRTFLQRVESSGYHRLATITRNKTRQLEQAEYQAPIARKGTK